MLRVKFNEKKRRVSRTSGRLKAANREGRTRKGGSRGRYMIRNIYIYIYVFFFQERLTTKSNKRK